MAKNDTVEIDAEKPELTAEVEADLAEAHAEKAEVAAEKAEDSAEAGRDVATDAAALAGAEHAEHITVEGVPNGLPPAAPEVALEPGDEVKTLREWFHIHIDNGGVHAQDTQHRNSLHNLMETMAAKLQAKHPVEKNT